ncbi:hypothetical protein QTP88_004447 [Uroleucon formosanum]
MVSAYSIPPDFAIELGNKSKYRLKIGAIPSIFNSNVKDRIINYDLRHSINFYHSYAKQYYNTWFKYRYQNIQAVSKHSNLIFYCFYCFSIILPSFIIGSEFQINFNKVVLPEGWATYFIFKSTLEVCLYIYQLSVQMDNLSFKLKYPFSLKDVSQTIEKQNHKNICQGGPSSINFPGIRVKTATLENNNLWHHLKCPILIDRRKRCETCDHLFQYFGRCKQRSLVKRSSYIGSVLTPTRRKTLTTILNDKNKLKKSNTRLRNVIEKLNFELGGMQEKMKSLSDTSVNQILVSSNLSDPQKILIQKIFKTSQYKNKKNRQYSEDWIYYILPLPCLRTIPKYLSLVKTKCAPYIRWAHYIEVYKSYMNRSYNAPSRVCPKITERHLAPDNFSKMSVKFATQILSDSTAKGIEFYRDYNKMDSLENNNETQQFTDCFNKLFAPLI